MYLYAYLKWIWNSLKLNMHNPVFGEFLIKEEIYNFRLIMTRRALVNSLSCAIASETWTNMYVE